MKRTEGDEAPAKRTLSAAEKIAALENKLARIQKDREFANAVVRMTAALRLQRMFRARQVRKKERMAHDAIIARREAEEESFRRQLTSQSTLIDDETAQRFLLNTKKFRRTISRRNSGGDDEGGIGMHQRKKSQPRVRARSRTKSMESQHSSKGGEEDEKEGRVCDVLCGSTSSGVNTRRTNVDDDELPTQEGCTIL